MHQVMGHMNQTSSVLNSLLKRSCHHKHFNEGCKGTLPVMPLSNGGEKILVGKKVINVEQNTPDSLTAVMSYSMDGIMVKLHSCITATMFLFL